MQQQQSLELVYSGSAQDFVNALCHEAKEHPATHHDFLQRLAKGNFPNIKAALRDYAFQYSFYSAHFPKYLQGAIDSLSEQKHKDVLLENLEEEKGDPTSSDLNCMPHTKLFELFQVATGIDDTFKRNSKPCVTVSVWSDLFLQKCRSKQLGVAVGAIGIATENIVPTVYSYILQCIRDHTQLTEDDGHFFKLHATCDDEHAEDLKQITIDLAEDFHIREAVRFGVFSGLNLRKAFWDIMLSRALEMKP